ncbi:MAG: hypothetical protein AAB375_01435 [Patescibacteria group bacterium]
MSDVLDLKNPTERGGASATTTDIATPVEALTISGPEPAHADNMTIDELAALTLSATIAPRTIAWEADHTLQGAARRKHYMLLGAFAAVGGLVALWQASLTGFLVVLAGAGALEARQRWSKPVRVAVNEHGIEVDGHHYPHVDLASFDIHTMPDGAMEVSLHSGRWHVPHLRLPLGEQNHEEVRAVFAQYIPEGRHPIPLLDYLIRKP